MYRQDDSSNRPVPPVRAEFQQSGQEESLLPRPQPPRRRDLEDPTSTTTTPHRECSCNYNRYATKKTIGHGLLEFALLTSNAMQLRTLVTQKQRDGIWIASLFLVCISIIVQLILAYILIIIGKGDIQDPEKQPKLEKYNNLTLFLTVLVSVINVIINAFMTSTDPSNFIDPSLLRSSTNHT